jgi:hypothetical protein
MSGAPEGELQPESPAAALQDLAAAYEELLPARLLGSALSLLRLFHGVCSLATRTSKPPRMRKTANRRPSCTSSPARSCGLFPSRGACRGELRSRCSPAISLLLAPCSKGRLVQVSAHSLFAKASLELHSPILDKRNR